MWIGNDDNKPLKGINGGGLPARIWRDFMAQAIEGSARPAPPQAPAEDRETLELPDLSDIPDIPITIDDSQITLGNDSSVSVDTEIGGVPLNLRVDRDGVAVERREAPNRRDAQR